MKKLFELLKQSLLDQEDVVLVTVIASSGSTPRGAGARMLVNRQGRLYGTIGGGAIEYQAQQRAADILVNKKSYLKGYKLTSGQVEDLGMILGAMWSSISSLSMPPTPNLSLVELILSLFDRDEDAWLITDISDETAGAWAFILKAKALSACPLSLNSLNLCWQAVPSGEPRDQALLCGAARRAGRVIVFGGGHVAQELVPVLTHVGFRCLVMDDRPEFANRSLFPTAHEIVVGDFQRIDDYIKITENDYVVVVTRGHHFDRIVTEQVLRKKTAYVGVIGSREKIAQTKARLEEAGIPGEALERVHAPIGLPIKAETPAEIAISIAGELILVRAERLEQVREMV